MSAGSGVVTPHAMASGGDGSGTWILYLTANILESGPMPTPWNFRQLLVRFKISLG